jgi:hypothetical protein
MRFHGALHTMTRPLVEGAATAREPLSPAQLTSPRCGCMRVNTPNTRRFTMPEIRWLNDADAALAEAGTARKPVLLDFSAAPM